MSVGPWAHRHGDERRNGVPKYDSSDVRLFGHFRERLGGLYRTHNYIFTVSLRRLAFEAAEKTYLLEIKRLQRKIGRLLKIRGAQTRKVESLPSR